MTNTLVPPLPDIPSKDPSSLRTLLTMRNDVIGLWPKQAYCEPHYRPKALFGKLILFNDAQSIKFIMHHSMSDFKRPTSVLRLLNPLMSKGLITSEGEEWRSQRKSLAPVFSPKYVDLLVKNFIAISENMIARLSSNRHINISDEMHKVALDGVLSALFSTSATDEFDFAKLIYGYLSGIGRPHPLDVFASSETDFARFFRGREIFAKRRKHEISLFVSKRLASSGQSAQPIKDLLDLLLITFRQGNELPSAMEQIEYQVATILFAGFETTSRNLFWTMYLLALDQASQQSIRDEVEAFPVHNVGSIADLQNWPYLRSVVFESLRLYPPGPNLAREAAQDISIHGVPVKRGEQVWVSPWVVHRHLKYWSKPNAFSPSRFQGVTNPTAIDNYLPFGTGPRTCIAANFAMAEVMLIIASVVQHFKFKTISNRPVIPCAAMTLAPSYEPIMEFVRTNFKP